VLGDRLDEIRHAAFFLVVWEMLSEEYAEEPSRGMIGRSTLEADESSAS
jgi:hypothetical protein